MDSRECAVAPPLGVSVLSVERQQLETRSGSIRVEVVVLSTSTGTATMNLYFRFWLSSESIDQCILVRITANVNNY